MKRHRSGVCRRKSRRCRAWPSPSIPDSRISPDFRYRGGFNPSPTRCDVPVEITSPGKRVINSLMLLIRNSTPKMKSDVFESCMVLPFTFSHLKYLLSFPPGETPGFSWSSRPKRNSLMRGYARTEPALFLSGSHLAKHSSCSPEAVGTALLVFHSVSFSENCFPSDSLHFGWSSHKRKAI